MNELEIIAEKFFDASPGKNLEIIISNSDGDGIKFKGFFSKLSYRLSGNELKFFTGCVESTGEVRISKMGNDYDERSSKWIFVKC